MKRIKIEKRIRIKDPLEILLKFHIFLGSMESFLQTMLHEAFPVVPFKAVSKGYLGH